MMISSIRELITAGSRLYVTVRSVYMHIMGDAVSADGVVVAGFVVAFTRNVVADPIASLLIAAFILRSSWGILRESATIMLEGTPPGTDMPGVIATIKEVSGVL